MAELMENWHVVLITLSAVLVGALVPAIIQLQLTLRNINRAIEQNAQLLQRTLEQTSEVASRANRMTTVLEEHSGDLESFLVTVGGISETVDRLRSTVSSMSTVAAFVAPAVAAAVTAFKSNGAAQTLTEPNERSNHKES